MKRYILDTNILLHYIRGKEKFQAIEAKLNLLAGTALILISSVTIGEIQGFIQRHKWGKEKLKAYRNLFNRLFVIDVSVQDEKLMDAYATIWNYSKNALPDDPLGKSIGIGQNDVWIAATAIAANATLISADSDFEHLNSKFLRLIKV